MLNTSVVCVALTAAVWAGPVPPGWQRTARCDISATMPQFGGAYVEAGMLHVWLTEPHPDTNATAAATLQAQCPELVGRATPEVVIHDADYSFTQLTAWEGSARSLLSRPDVALTAVNPRANRVTVGVDQPDASRDEVLAELARQGVPEAAVEVVPAKTFTPDAAPRRSKLWILAATSLAVLAIAGATLARRRMRKRGGARCPSGRGL